MASEFGAILKDWRKTRRFSQLDLSLEAEMSARHLSFLESGRANPSRAMVLRLSEAARRQPGAARGGLCAGLSQPVGRRAGTGTGPPGDRDDARPS